LLLLDTDVVIDIARQYPGALAWLRSLSPNEEIALPGYVVMEMIQGCASREEVNKIRASLAPYRVYWPTDADCSRAIADFAEGKLSQGIGMIDALIGETAVGLGVPIQTFNVKHFKAIPNLVIQTPYAR
jgi:predicted nucleic acid-binding protein